MKRYSAVTKLCLAAVLAAVVGVIILCLAGCSKPPRVTPGTISISDTTVRSTLFDLGVSEGTACVLLGNPQYSLPSAGWVTGDFATQFRAWVGQEGLHYQTSEEDCKTFSRMAALYCDMLHAKDPGRQPGTHLAFGEFWYISARGGHAINVALVADGPVSGTSLPKYRLLFFEPQTGLEVLLTRQEIESCVMCRI